MIRVLLVWRDPSKKDGVFDTGRQRRVRQAGDLGAGQQLVCRKIQLARDVADDGVVIARDDLYLDAR